jgi:hypothetical protein
MKYFIKNPISSLHMMMPIGIHGIFPVMTQKLEKPLGPNQDFVEPFGSNGLNQLAWMTS